jgi:hypothetical protein
VIVKVQTEPARSVIGKEALPIEQEIWEITKAAFDGVATDSSFIAVSPMFESVTIWVPEFPPKPKLCEE